VRRPAYPVLGRADERTDMGNRASEELIENMKKGQAPIVRAVKAQGEVINLSLPLNDFGKAYDGPSSEPEPIRGAVK
jgi:antirestriction protein ArdC